MATKKAEKPQTPAQDAPKVHKEGFIRKPDGTIEMTVIIPWNVAEKTKEAIEKTLVKNVKIEGFRPGQAPAHIAKQRINPELVREEMLKEVVGKAYNEAVEKNKLTPIITPRVHIEVFTDGTDIVFTAETCEEPKVELGKYKAAVEKVNKKGKIVVPGKEEEKPSLDEILEAALKEAKVEVADVLVENEISRLLSQMLDELKKLGLTLEQYIASRKITAEELREEYKKKATRDIQLEFFLRAVANEEKITVEKEDIDTALTTVENPQERNEIMKNPYLVASIIRQQKTLDFLSKL